MAPKASTTSTETYAEKSARIDRRLSDLDVLRTSRLLTFEEVTEYFTLIEELNVEAHSSDDDYGTDPQHRLLRPRGPVVVCRFTATSMSSINALSPHTLSSLSLSYLSLLRGGIN